MSTKDKKSGFFGRMLVFGGLMLAQGAKLLGILAKFKGLMSFLSMLVSVLVYWWTFKLGLAGAVLFVALPVSLAAFFVACPASFISCFGLCSSRSVFPTAVPAKATAKNKAGANLRTHICDFPFPKVNSRTVSFAYSVPVGP